MVALTWPSQFRWAGLGTLAHGPSAKYAFLSL